MGELPSEEVLRENKDLVVQLALELVKDIQDETNSEAHRKKAVSDLQYLWNKYELHTRMRLSKPIQDEIGVNPPPQPITTPTPAPSATFAALRGVPTKGI